MLLSDELCGHVLETARDYVEETGIRLHSGYSGRGMCGQTCLAFYNGDLDRFFVDLAIDCPDECREELRQILKRRRNDSFGLDMISYFPGIETPDALIEGFAEIRRDCGLEE